MHLFLVLFGAAYTSVGIAFFLTRLPALLFIIGSAIYHMTQEPEECASCGEKHHHSWIEAIFVILDVTARSLIVGLLWPYAIYKVVKNFDEED